MTLLYGLFSLLFAGSRSGLRRFDRDDRGMQAAEALALAGVGVVVIVILMGLLQSTGENVIRDLEEQIISNEAPALTGPGG